MKNNLLNIYQLRLLRKQIMPMTTKITHKMSILIGIIFVLSMFIQASYAQNFSNFAPVETKQDQNFLSDEEIGKILMDEGIPLTPNQNIVNIGANSGTESKYTLGNDDVIEISVLRHPEVSGKFVINNEGKIQYEFIGDVEVAGKTKKKVTEVLVKILSKYIISPEVTVQILGYNSKVVYVIGEVGSPGKIFMRGDTITIREALVQSGLPLINSKSSKSKLITPADNGKAKVINVNVYKLLYKGDLRENLVMKPGDTLYIPPTALTKAMRVIQPVSAPVGAASRTGRILTTGF